MPILLLGAAPALACSCLGADPGSVPVIIEGKVIAIDEPGHMRVKVTRTIKGRSLPERTVMYHAGPGASCGVSFELNEEVRIAAGVNGAGVLSTSLCTMLAGRGDFPQALTPPLPADSSQLADYATARSEDNDPESALAAWNALAAAKTPALNLAEARAVLVMIELEQKDEAKTRIEAALQRAPDDGDLRHAHAALLIAIGKGAEIPTDYRDFHDLTIEHVSLAGRDLTGANFNRATLNDVNLAGAKLDKADMREIRLANCDLSGASLRGADLSAPAPPPPPDPNDPDARMQAIMELRRDRRGYFNAQLSNFAGADLTGANLTYADLTGFWFKDANFSQVQGGHAKMGQANLLGARFTGSDWRDAVWSGIKASGADLSGVILAGADLRGADLSNAKLDAADLTGAKIEGADLMGVTGSKWTRWPEGFTPAIAGAPASVTDPWPEATACIASRSYACILDRLQALKDKDVSYQKRDEPLLNLATALLLSGRYADGRRVVKILDGMPLSADTNILDVRSRFAIIKALLARHEQALGPDLMTEVKNGTGEPRNQANIGPYPDFIYLAARLGDGDGAVAMIDHFMRVKWPYLHQRDNLPAKIADAMRETALTLAQAGKGRAALALAGRIADDEFLQKFYNLKPGSTAPAASREAALADVLKQIAGDADADVTERLQKRADLAQTILAAATARFATGDRAGAKQLIDALADAQDKDLAALKDYPWQKSGGDDCWGPMRKTMGPLLQSLDELVTAQVAIGEADRAFDLIARLQTMMVELPIEGRCDDFWRRDLREMMTARLIHSDPILARRVLETLPPGPKAPERRGQMEEMEPLQLPQLLMALIKATPKPDAALYDNARTAIEAIPMASAKAATLLQLAELAASKGDADRAAKLLDEVPPPPAPKNESVRQPNLAMSMTFMGGGYRAVDPLLQRGQVLARLGRDTEAEAALDDYLKRQTLPEGVDPAALRARLGGVLAEPTAARGDTARAEALLQAAFAADLPTMPGQKAPIVDLSALRDSTAPGGFDMAKHQRDQAEHIAKQKKLAPIMARLPLALSALRDGRAADARHWLAALNGLPADEKQQLQRYGLHGLFESGCQIAVDPAAVPEAEWLLTAPTPIETIASCRMAGRDALADHLLKSQPPAPSTSGEEIADRYGMAASAHTAYLNDDWPRTLKTALTTSESDQRQVSVLAAAAERRLRALAYVDLAGIFQEKGETALAEEAEAALANSVWLPAAQLRRAAVMLRQGDAAGGVALRTAAAAAVTEAKALPVDRFNAWSRPAHLLMLEAEAAAAAGEANPDTALTPVLEKILPQTSSPADPASIIGWLSDSLARRGSVPQGITDAAKKAATDGMASFGHWGGNRDDGYSTALARLPGVADIQSAAQFAALEAQVKAIQTNDPNSYRRNDSRPDQFDFWIDPAQFLAQLPEADKGGAP